MLANKERIVEFEKEVIDEFEFLVSEYGFNRKQLIVSDLRYPPDARVSVPFIGESVGVEIVLGLGDHSISIVFYKLENGQKPKQLSFYPKSKGADAVRLETVIRKLGGSEVLLPLPEITPQLSMAEMVRRGEARSELIRKDLGRILSKYASLVKEYASMIMEGDVSDFQEMKEDYAKHWEIPRAKGC